MATFPRFAVGGIIVLSFFMMHCSAYIFVGGPTRQQLKKEILDLALKTKRGTIATPQEEALIEEKFQQLERLNPTKRPLKTSLVNGVWDLQYTTSSSINGKGDWFNPRFGPILQKIDTTTLSAENSEVVNYGGWLKVPRKVTAKLSPQTDQLTNVQFEQFTIGPFQFKAPSKFQGKLDITYLDQDLRLTRGDKGNLFVLTRYQQQQQQEED